MKEFKKNYRRLVVSGDQVMLSRHHLLLDSLMTFFDEVIPVASPALIPRKRHLIREAFNGFPLFRYLQFPRGFDYHKSSWAFQYKSAKIAECIEKIRPDLVLHIFSMSAPVKKQSAIPYVVTLDYTMALAERNYPAWALFPSKKERDKWRTQESDLYNRAKIIFAWSKVVAESLERDYGVDKSKIIITGSSGNLQAEFSEQRMFGSGKVLMNGSDFTRKGGEIAVEAFKLVRGKFSDATLQFVGIEQGPEVEGITYLGPVDTKKMKQLFFEADLVLGPAHCDPYPGFIVEAMGFGTPCIVSDKDGMPEIVDHGINGIVLKHLNAESLADAIIALLSNKNLLQQFSVEAHQKVKEKLNWHNLAKTIAETSLQNELLKY